MTSLCSLRLAPPRWRRESVSSFFLLLNFKTRALSFIPITISSSLNHEDDDGSVLAPKPKQLGYDLSEDLFGIEGNPKPRNGGLDAPKPRSWFGPNGQYIREQPCPSCRGRGYAPCTECGIERSRSDCSQCDGKGIMTCRQCVGDCVIWEESIDE